MSDRKPSNHDIQSRRDILEGLEHVLGNKKDGEIVFGAAGEPLYVSQTEILAGIEEHLGNTLNEANVEGHIVAPGGSGKTRTGIALGAAAAYHRRKTLFVVDRQESLQKFAAEARQLMPNVPIGEVYQEEKTIGDLTFITVNSLRSRVKAWREGIKVEDGAAINPHTFDMVLWDEAHMYLTPKAQALKNEFSHCVNLGFTATPRYYEGKEVGDSFGPLIKEIDYETGLARGEVNKYDSFLINTGITTGLTDLLPDQEESDAVAKVSNRRDRNLILADLYKNGRVNRGGKMEYLAGKPLLAFVATINHAHDQADAINEALMPALKSDTVFRQHLRDCGIDPDKVERIAAPIHSGDSEQHDGMLLKERNKVVEDYDARRTLMLISTSVLQQSFNNKKTQVVVDTVPRMTYVGAGQAGYRGTRTDDGKPDSILISYEDKDRPTLTFDDFIGARKRKAEQGTVFPTLDLSESTNKPSELPEQVKDHPVAPYKIIGGKDMTKLLIKREEARMTERDRLTREDEDYLANSRHFTPAGYQNIHNLMVRIGRGDSHARNEFLVAIQPFVDRSAERIAGQIFGLGAVNEEDVHEVVNDVLFKLVEDSRHFQGASRSWSNFGQRVQNELRSQFSILKKRQSAEERYKAEGMRHVNNVSGDLPESDPQVLYNKKELARAVPEALDSLTPREAKVLRMMHGIGGQDEASLDELGRYFDVTRERIRQIESKATRKLKHPSRSDKLRTFLETDFPIGSRAPDMREHFMYQVRHARDELLRLFGSRESIEAILPADQYRALMEFDYNSGSMWEDPGKERHRLVAGQESIYTSLAAVLEQSRSDDPYTSNKPLVRLQNALQAIVSGAKAARYGTLDFSTSPMLGPTHVPTYFSDVKHEDVPPQKSTDDRLKTNTVGTIHSRPSTDDDIHHVVRQPSLSNRFIDDTSGQIRRDLVGLSTCRDRLKVIFANSDGEEFDQKAFMKETGLNKKQYQALMEADLHVDMKSRDLLRQDQVKIYQKLSAALKERGNDDVTAPHELQQATRRIIGLAASSSLRMRGEPLSGAGIVADELDRYSGSPGYAR